MQRGFGLVVLVALLAGCNQGKPGELVTNVPSANQPVNTPMEPGTGVFTPPGSNAPSGNTAAPMPSIEHKPEVFAIKPAGQAGYTPVPKTEAPSESVALGRRMDDALFAVKNRFVEIETNYNVGGATLSGRGFVKLGDRKRYSIEYFLPRTEGATNRLVADGTRRASMVNGKWERKGAFPELAAEAKLPVEMKEFTVEFPRYLFAPITDGVRVWEGLFRGLEKDGYTLTYEEQETKVGEASRTVARILATKGATQMEFVVDETDAVPMTVRVQRPGGTGTDRMMWTAIWNAGGTFAPNEFVVP